MSLGDYEGAVEDYTKAIELNANDADIYYNRGYYNKKLENYNEAFQLNPNDEWVKDMVKKLKKSGFMNFFK